MAPRISRLAIAVVLQLGAVVLAHQLIYLARYGSRFGEALIHSGHGEAWAGTVASAVILALGLAAMAATRLVRLGLLVRGEGGAHAAARDGLERSDLVRGWLRLAPRLALLSLVLLSIQENLEQAAIGLSMPGPGILLSPEYAGGAWIAIAVAFLVGFVAALFEWRSKLLLARLRALRGRLGRATAVILRPAQRLAQPVESELGRKSALRAPPRLVTA